MIKNRTKWETRDACETPAPVPSTQATTVAPPSPTCTITSCTSTQHCEADIYGGKCVDNPITVPAVSSPVSTPGGCGPDERCQAYYQALKSCQDQGGGGCDVAAGEAWARVEEGNAQKARRGDVSAQKKAADWTVVQEARDQGLDVSALSTDEVKAKFYGTLPEDKKIPCADQACLAGDVARNSCRDYNSKSGLNLDCEVWAHQEYDRVKAAICSDPVACKDIESHEQMTPDQIKTLLANKISSGVGYTASYSVDELATAVAEDFCRNDPRMQSRDPNALTNCIKAVAYDILHFALPGMINNDLKPIGNLIYDYRFNMGSIANCSYCYPPLVDIAERLRYTKKEGMAEVLAISSVGPAFFAITQNLKMITHAFETENLKTFATEIDNDKYKVTNKAP